MGRVRNWLWSKAGWRGENWRVGRQRRGLSVVGSCWTWTLLLQLKSFPFLTAPEFPGSPPGWEIPESGKMSVSQGRKIPVYSFTKRGNMWKGRVRGEENMLCLGELVVFPSMWRTQELNSLLERYDFHSLWLSSVYIYMYIYLPMCVYVCVIYSQILGIFGSEKRV